MMFEFMDEYNEAYLAAMEVHPSIIVNVVEIGGGMWDPSVRGSLNADQIQSYDRLRAIWDAIVWPAHMDTIGDDESEAA